ncbi:restriction endonuclease subunit S [Lactobacillus sp. ESL0680]|uniref:restriction endonuclease subunit S n=1 Tax=Lactobacillus sp. ESL0680 TaxID=2983210 RepID=UPI0023F9A09F|nr:restriction endonuclease subunit S [Lactobacillus sp. ESL0680]WEV38157.1 restriction endonuclease subunit S [Lactobacillus sp. ESL0680]
MSKDTNVPRIRFKGFTNAWEQQKFKEILKEFSIRSKIENEYPVLSSTNSGMEIRNGRVSSESNIGYKIVKNGNLVFSPQNLWLGNINVNYIGTGLVSPSYKTLNFKKVNPQFIIPQLKTSKMLEKYKNASTQGASVVRRNLDTTAFYQITIRVPNIAEQSKIGNFFNKVNSILTLQERKLELYKQLKKYLLQKMFANEQEKVPQIRFKGFDEDWEKDKLSQLTDRIKRKNNELTSNTPLTISAKYGLIKQTLFFNKEVASKNLRNYILLKKGEFAYNKSYSTDFPFGAIKRLDKYNYGALSTLYIAFKTRTVDSDYLVCYFDSNKWHKEIYQIATEGARNHGLLNISPVDFFNSKLVIPKNVSEQFKIGKLIIKIDNYLKWNYQIQENYSKLKQYLLQNLFC